MCVCTFAARKVDVEQSSFQITLYQEWNGLESGILAYIMEY